jgi:hypothetical protein
MAKDFTTEKPLAETAEYQPDLSGNATPDAIANGQEDRTARLLKYCATSKTIKQMLAHLGLKSRYNFRKKILAPLLESGQMRMTLPKRPVSVPRQKYITVRTTPKEYYGKVVTRKKAVLAYLEEHDHITVIDAVKKFRLSSNRARSFLRDMADEGTLEKIGYRDVRYVLKKK